MKSKHFLLDSKVDHLMQIRQFLAFDTKLANNGSETSQIEKKKRIKLLLSNNYYKLQLT